MVKHNNALPNVHLRKHWGKFVRTWFDQPAKKRSRYQTRKSKAEKIFPRPIKALRPIVAGQTRRYSGKARYGRGFTLEELRRAGLTAQFARTVGISVDHRRTNANTEALERNVKRLETYKSKMILFPLKQGKHKKGLIADSTAEQIESEAAKNQNTSRHVLDIPRESRREKKVEMTEDIKKHRAYQQLRQAQIDHKYGRKRFRQQKFKEAVEKAKAEGKEAPKTKRQMKSNQ